MCHFRSHESLHGLYLDVYCPYVKFCAHTGQKNTISPEKKKKRDRQKTRESGGTPPPPPPIEGPPVRKIKTGPNRRAPIDGSPFFKAIFYCQMYKKTWYMYHFQSHENLHGLYLDVYCHHRAKKCRERIVESG